MAYKMNAATVCPCCGSGDIDLKARECRSCGVGLPSGSLDIYYRSTLLGNDSRRYKASVANRRNSNRVGQLRVVEGIGNPLEGYERREVEEQEL